MSVSLGFSYISNRYDIISHPEDRSDDLAEIKVGKSTTKPDSVPRTDGWYYFVVHFGKVIVKDNIFTAFIMPAISLPYPLKTEIT